MLDRHGPDEPEFLNGSTGVNLHLISRHRDRDSSTGNGRTQLPLATPFQESCGFDNHRGNGSTTSNALDQVPLTHCHQTI